MRDKDPERGMKSEKSREEISSKRQIKSERGEKIRRERRGDALILIT